jgi:hypothetical protein
VNSIFWGTENKTPFSTFWYPALKANKVSVYVSEKKKGTPQGGPRPPAVSSDRNRAETCREKRPMAAIDARCPAAAHGLPQSNRGSPADEAALHGTEDASAPEAAQSDPDQDAGCVSP